MAGKHSNTFSHWVYTPPQAAQLSEGNAEESVVPELLMLGCLKYVEAFPVSLHCHEHAYEFVYLEHGSVTWEMNGEYYPTSAGQWFYTRPGEFHKARFNYMEPSRIWWFILKDPNDDPGWFRLNAAEREIVKNRMRQLPRVFRAGHRVREQFVRLKATIDAESSEMRWVARHQLLEILLELLLQPTPVKKIEPELVDAVSLTVHMMASSPDNRFSIADMARAVKVSESHYYKLFREIFGQSPAAYMERLRMERACALLKTGMPVTEVSLELGFKTSQHFATVFRKWIGSSPSVWRKSSR